MSTINLIEWQDCLTKNEKEHLSFFKKVMTLEWFEYFYEKHGLNCIICRDICDKVF